MKKLLSLCPKWWEAGTLLCVGVLPALVIFLFIRYPSNNVNPISQDLKDWKPPAVEVKQLPSENDVIPVEIRRAKALFKSPNDIEALIIVSAMAAN